MADTPSFLADMMPKAVKAMAQQTVAQVNIVPTVAIGISRPGFLASSAIVAITSYPTNRTLTNVSVLKIWATLLSSPTWMKKPLSLQNLGAACHLAAMNSVGHENHDEHQHRQPDGEKQEEELERMGGPDCGQSRVDQATERAFHPALKGKIPLISLLMQA